MDNMSTFVIAGGAGFIGSHISERLLGLGYKVICIDNLITGVEENISPFFSNKNFIFIKHNIIESLPQVKGEIDGIFHLASPASPNAKSPRSYMAHPIHTLMVNSVGTRNLLEFAREKKSKLLYASSSEVYGDPAITPQKEDYFGNVNPNGPRSVYDEGKRFGEAISAAYTRVYNLDVRTIRIFNTYGDRMQKDDGRVVSNFIHQALEDKPITIYGDGNQTRSFCYIDDLVNGLISAIQKPNLAGFVMNLGNPEEYKIIDLAKEIIKLTQSKSEIVYEKLPQDDPHRRCPDISKASRMLDFKPKVSLVEGLTKTIEYFKSVNY